MVFAGACGPRSQPLRDTLPPHVGSTSPYVQGDASGPANAPRIDVEASADEADALALPEAGATDTDLAGCGASGSIMYLLADTGVIRTFDPVLVPTGSPFRTLGPLACKLADGTPWTRPGDIAIDRAGVVWINASVGNLFRWDPSNATCTQTPLAAGQSGFTNMGMTFVGSADGTETLLVDDNANGPLSNGGQGLATIDLVTFRLTLLANFGAPLTGRVAELAGTADGRVYGFFYGPDSWIAEIDPSNGAVLWSTQVPVSLVGSGPTHVTVAAALWEHVLYFFVTNTAVAPSADVYGFDLTTRQTTPLLSQIGFNVTGAVVHTCGATPSAG